MVVHDWTYPSDILPTTTHDLPTTSDEIIYIIQQEQEVRKMTNSQDVVGLYILLFPIGFFVYMRMCKCDNFIPHSTLFQQSLKME